MNTLEPGAQREKAMLHRSTVIAGVLVASSVALRADALSAQESKPQFASVAIAATSTDSTAPTGMPDVGLFRRANVTVAALAQFAYGIGAFELIGGPDWIRADRFDVTANAGRAASETEMRQMVQSLLEDRFALEVKREVRDMSHYVLRASSAGSLGPRLHQCDPSAPPAAPAPMPLPPGAVPMTAACVPMSEVARRASTAVAAPIVDRSELKGLWSYRITVQQPKAGEPVGPLVASAFREQLGLDLQQTTAALPVLVVQSVARPKTN